MLASNPLSTRFTRPGAIPFLFPEGTSGASLVRQLAEHSWRGKIVGPHGSGKSTLLESLLPEIAAQGKQVERFALHQGERKLPEFAVRALKWNSQTLVAIDGYEQLGCLSRARLHRACRKFGVGLLVTAHDEREGKLPTLYRTRIDEATAWQIVLKLMPDENRTIARDDLRAAMAAHGNDFREVLFQLYDLVEARRR